MVWHDMVTRAGTQHGQVLQHPKGMGDDFAWGTYVTSADGCPGAVPAVLLPGTGPGARRGDHPTFVLHYLGFLTHFLFIEMACVPMYTQDCFLYMCCKTLRML